MKRILGMGLGLFLGTSVFAQDPPAHGGEQSPEAVADEGKIVVPVKECSPKDQLLELIESEKIMIEALERFRKEYKNPTEAGINLSGDYPTIYNALYYRALMSMGAWGNKAGEMRKKTLKKKGLLNDDNKYLELDWDSRATFGGIVAGVLKPAYTTISAGGGSRGSDINDSSLSESQRQNLFSKIQSGLDAEMDKKRQNINTYETILRDNFAKDCPAPNSELASWISATLALNAKKSEHAALNGVKGSIEKEFSNAKSDAKLALSVGALAPVIFFTELWGIPGSKILKKYRGTSDQVLMGAAALGLSGLEKVITLSLEESNAIAEFNKRVPAKLEEQEKDIERLQKDLDLKQKALTAKKK